MTERRHSADIVFSLLIFCVFAGAVLLALTSGAGVYRRTVDETDARYEERTAIGYIAAKVRRCNEAGAVSVGSFGDGSALFLREDYGDFAYVTTVYCLNGELTELYCEEGLGLAPDAGTAVVPAKSVEFEKNGSLLHISCVSMQGRVSDMYISLTGEGAE